MQYIKSVVLIMSKELLNWLLSQKYLHLWKTLKMKINTRKVIDLEIFSKSRNQEI